MVYRQVYPSPYRSRTASGILVRGLLSTVGARALHFTPKTASVLYRRRGRLLPSCLPLFLGGECIRRVKEYRYLGVIIDDRVS